jgi:DNA-binding HxlR family transcriptional regulator
VQAKGVRIINPLNDAICVQSIGKIMKIFGGKWSFLILGELHTETMRFNELSRNLGVSTKSLSDALKSLESNGVIIRTVQPTTPVTIEYALTEKGRDFERVFLEMREWGKKWLVT